jgi:hypothetical protein
MANTPQEFDQVINDCREIFLKKMSDYGPAWRIMRPASITDQIFIKANRIRSIETKGISLVDDDIHSELIGIVNYSVIGLIQFEMGYSDKVDMSSEKALSLYEHYVAVAKKLMLAKNHDYDEAWRSMRTQSYTDLILMKLYRVKQIENNEGETVISEGIDANYLDIINYAVFGLIKMTFAKE